MIVGQKVICVNDENEPVAVTPLDGHLVRVPLYTNWIKKGTTYLIREVCLGVSPAGEPGQIALLLAGINNPPTPWKPFAELAFNSERFVPIEEKTSETHVNKPATLPVRHEVEVPAHRELVPV